MTKQYQQLSFLDQNQCLDAAVDELLAQVPPEAHKELLLRAIFKGLVQRLNHFSPDDRYRFIVWLLEEYGDEPTD